MKKMTLCGVIVFCVVLTGCGRHQFHMQTMARDFKAERPALVHDAGPVALKNGATEAPGTEQIVCSIRRLDVNTSVYDFTNSAIGSAKSAFQAVHVAVDDTAAKTLEFTIPTVRCDTGWRFSFGMTLRVKTGSGVIREYQGSEPVATVYQAAAAEELSILQCIEQMLNDKEIAAYLGSTGK